MTTATTKHVLASTGTTTKAVLSAVGDRKWWTDTLKWVRPLSHGGQEIDERANRHENSEFSQHGCHPFYEDVTDDPYISQVCLVVFSQHISCSLKENISHLPLILACFH